MKIDGSMSEMDDFYVEDFTVADLKQLRLRQVVHDPSLRNQAFNGLFQIPTFEEFIDFVQQRAGYLGIKIGIIPELKHPGHYRLVNLNASRPETYFEDEVMRILSLKGYALRGVNSSQSTFGPVILQSVESQTLKYLRQQSNLTLLQLAFDPFQTEGLTGIPQDWFFTPQGLDIVSSYANFLGMPKSFLLEGGIATLSQNTNFNVTGVYHQDIEALGGYIATKELISEMHRRYLMASVFTFRNEREDDLVRQMFSGDFESELQHFMEMGVDSLFVEKLGPSFCARRLAMRTEEHSEEEEERECDKTLPWKIATIFMLFLNCSLSIFLLQKISRDKRHRNDYMPT